jgi:hypothetical protein
MGEGPGEIGFDLSGIGSVLNRHNIRVPVNQREYAWEEHHVKALLQDIAAAIADDEPEYFLGTIVGIPRKAETLQIVDGQQRLATTVILLAAIRDYLKKLPAEQMRVDFIEREFLRSIDPEQQAFVPRLRLNTADASYFERRVLDSDEKAEATLPSHRRIDDAARIAKGHVAAVVQPHAEPKHGEVLNEVVRFMQLKARVGLFRTPTEVNAYRMFETLNDRGLKTSQADLVKNFLFGKSGDRIEEAQARWAGMKALLESLDDEDITITFLRQMLVSFYGHLRDHQIYETVQRYAGSTRQAIEFLGSLETVAADYVAILNPAHEKWNAYPASTRKAIHTLGYLRMKAMRPLMLSLTRTMPRKEADRAFRLLVDLVVRYLIVGGSRTGTAEQGLAGAAKNVSEGKITTAKSLLKELARLAPTDAEFQDQFKIATVSQARLARYYLRSLELQKRGSAAPAFVPNDSEDVINLEHVLPKKREGNWPQFTDEEADAFLNRIGNLALLRAKDNANQKSAGFSAKRVLYAASEFGLTKQVGRAKEWNTTAISDRQEQLAALAVETWPLKVK